MCKKIDCSKCGKPSWSGCGMHIETALAGIKEEERCMGWKTGICVQLSNSVEKTEKKT